MAAPGVPPAPPASQRASRGDACSSLLLAGTRGPAKAPACRPRRPRALITATAARGPALLPLTWCPPEPRRSACGLASAASGGCKGHARGTFHSGRQRRRLFCPPDDPAAAVHRAKIARQGGGRPCRGTAARNHSANMFDHPAIDSPPDNDSVHAAAPVSGRAGAEAVPRPMRCRRDCPCPKGVAVPCRFAPGTEDGGSSACPRLPPIACILL